jgi:hypothetical protein
VAKRMQRKIGIRGISVWARFRISPFSVILGVDFRELGARLEAHICELHARRSSFPPFASLIPNRLARRYVATDRVQFPLITSNRANWLSRGKKDGGRTRFPSSGGVGSASHSFALGLKWSTSAEPGFADKVDSCQRPSGSMIRRSGCLFFLLLRGSFNSSSDSAAHHGGGDQQSAVCSAVFRTDGGCVDAEGGCFPCAGAASFTPKPIEGAGAGSEEWAEGGDQSSQAAARIVEVAWQ